MNETTKIFALFPQVVYTSTLNNISDKQLLKINNILKKQNIENSGIKDYVVFEDNSHGSQSKKLLDNPQLEYLKDIFLNEFNVFKNEVLKLKKNDFIITTSWMAKVKPKKSSQFHNHHHCYYSGVFYTNTNESSGNIIFENFTSQKRFDVIPSDYNVYNSGSWRIKPENKMIIFFPSEMYHKIDKNNSNITRYSIAFNLLPTGIIGEGDSAITLR
jgi:uncharacterized protein (TIGR02466 family)